MSFLNNADDEFQIWEDNHCNLGASSIIDFNEKKKNSLFWNIL